MSRKNKDPGRVRQIHQQKSFEDYVASATLSKLSGYINQELQNMGQALLQRQAQAVQNLFIRILSLEEILTEKLDGVSKEVLAERVATIQDRNEGYSTVEEGVAVGDRVRLEIKTKTADQTEFQGTSRLLIDNAGSGHTLGKEIEEAVIGMKAGETKEIKFGKDQSLTASLTISRVSRAPKSEAAEETAEAAEDGEAVAPAEPTTEGADVSANAG